MKRRIDDDDVLLVQRPDDDDEFPGMWGLPAASCRDGEDLMAAARRIGDQKLGARLKIGRTLGSGSQNRESYIIRMTLLEAVLEDSAGGLQPSPPKVCRGACVTLYTAFRWGRASDLTASAAAGSLCSQLLLNIGD